MRNRIKGKRQRAKVNGEEQRPKSRELVIRNS